MSRFQTFNYTDAEEKVSTIRNPQSALLLLDSRDRYTIDGDGEYDEKTETNPNNIKINHQRTLGAGQIKRIAVTEFSFPWSTPNVNERNNILYITDTVSGIQYYITVTENFYTPSELAAEITSILTTQGWKDATTGIPDISYNAPWSCTVNNVSRFTLKSKVGSTEWKVQPGSGLADLMNIQAITSEPDSSGNYYIRGGIPSMAYTSYIDVCSKTLTKFQNLKDSLTQLNYNDIICRIYLQNDVNTPTSDTAYFACRPCINLCRQFKTPKNILWNENEMINSIDIQLYDDAGELLYIPIKNWDLDYFLTIQMSES